MKMANFTIVIESEYGCEVNLCDFDDITEARKFCNSYNWQYEDENGFCWTMCIRHNRV